MNTDPRVTESVLAISVCKNPIRKTIHTEIAKIAKKGTNHGSKGHQSESVLETFAISVCKTPIRKDNLHGDRKDRKERDEPRIERPPIRIGLSGLCDPCV
jgi:hypothetical protein